MLPCPKVLSGYVKTYSSTAFYADLDELKRAWCKLQKCRERDGIYKFLTEVFELVSWWLSDPKVKIRAFIKLDREWTRSADVELFARAIIIAAEPVELDKRTVSKWSRVLRLAYEFKPRDLSLKRYIKRHGGLNQCASEYACRLGRLSQD
jgi:hypothetical protein